MYRREVYCTSGTRPAVRVFGGWDFTANELGNPESVCVEQGYKRGVPMGGDLPNRLEGKAPTFMVKALYDPDGAYLDRIQIIKGWLDGNGVTHEKIIDVAWSGDRKPNRTKSFCHGPRRPGISDLTASFGGRQRWMDGDLAAARSVSRPMSRAWQCDRPRIGVGPLRDYCRGFCCRASARASSRSRR